MNYAAGTSNLSDMQTNTLQNNDINMNVDEITINIVGSAPHELLVSSANQAYMQTHEEIRNLENQLEQANRELQTAKQELKSEKDARITEVNTWKDVANTLMKNSSNIQVAPVSRVGKRCEALETAFSTAYDTTNKYQDDLIDEKTDKKDERRLQYPSVKYWTKDQFKYLDTDTNPSETFPKKLRFLEDEDGDLISQDRLDEMRAHLLHAFEEIRTLLPSLLSNGWLNKNRKLSNSTNVSEDDEVEITGVVPAKRAQTSKKDRKARKKAKNDKGKGKIKIEPMSDGTTEDEEDADMPEKSEEEPGVKRRKPIQLIDPLYISFYYIHLSIIIISAMNSGSTSSSVASSKSITSSTKTTAMTPCASLYRIDIN
ncbi:hypothetical protein JOM56_014350 [Amanita muscaria]